MYRAHPHDPDSIHTAMHNDDGKVPSGRKPRHKFTAREDIAVFNFAVIHGPKRWSEIVAILPDRSPRQCRERWRNYLSPSVRHSEWTSQEDALLIEKVDQYGARWSKIVEFFPNRAGVILRNRYNLLKRRGMVHSSGGGEPALQFQANPQTSKPYDFVDCQRKQETTCPVVPQRNQEADSVDLPLEEFLLDPVESCSWGTDFFEVNDGFL